MLIAALLILAALWLGATLLWSLTLNALPLACGALAALGVYHAGGGMVSGALAGFAAAAAALAIGQLLIAGTTSSLRRGSVGLVFAVPAAFAGYHAAHGLAAIFMDEGFVARTVPMAAALIVGWASWTRCLDATRQSRRA